MEHNIAIVNVCITGSTGKIALGLHRSLLARGYHAYLCYGRGEKVNDESFYRIDSPLEVSAHAFMTRLLGDQGSYSRWATYRFIRFLESKKVDVVFAVNLHAYYLHEQMFFDYINRKGIRLVYIMADEYPFLGKCCYHGECDRYLMGCGHCPSYRHYPSSLFFDRSRKIYKNKAQAYSRLKKAVFVAPEFVINKARKAPLMKGIQLEIVDEAIDAVRCTPRDNKEIRRRLGIADDKVVIGCVAPFRQFGGSKGADYFLELAKRMEGDSRLVFLHVGYNMDTALCPSNYIPIAFVADQQELPDYYSVADLLVHPSLQDTMPSTCLEALACGTPLLCFNISGMPYIGDETVMTLVETKNVDQMVDVVKSTEKKTEKIINTCRNYALNRYDERKYAEKLLSLMESIQ